MVYDLSLHCSKVQHWVELSSNLYDSFSDSFLPSPPTLPSNSRLQAHQRWGGQEICIINSERGSHSVHTMHVNFSFFLYISQPCACYPRREITCFAVVWPDDKFNIFSPYFQTTLEHIFKAKQLETTGNYCKKGTSLKDVQAVSTELLG